MSAPNLSTVICNPEGRHIVCQATDTELVAALLRAELKRRGVL